MFVFICYRKTEYRIGARARKQHREPKRVAVSQSKRQQDCLSQLGAKKWDCSARDYSIYRVNVGHKPTTGLLASIGEACEACGLSGPYFGDGAIAWQGQGAGSEKHVGSKLRRQMAETYLKGKLDILAQIRVLAGVSSQFEAFNLPDVSLEMRERWTALLTPELERWTEYLAEKAQSSESASAAYNQAIALLSTSAQHQAFLSDTENSLHYAIGDNLPRNEKTGNIQFPSLPVRKHGRSMMQSELDSLKACVADASIMVETVFVKPVQAIASCIEEDPMIVDFDMNRKPIYLQPGFVDPLA